MAKPLIASTQSIRCLLSEREFIEMKFCSKVLLLMQIYLTLRFKKIKSIYTHLSHFALLLAGLWVLVFAVLPHHHDVDTGMPCLDFHHHQHESNHDECGLTKAFLIEFQREDYHVLFPVYAQALADDFFDFSLTNEKGFSFISKPYEFAVLLSERVFDFPGRAPPVALV